MSYNIGINLKEVSYIASEVPLVNRAKQFDVWRPMAYGTDHPTPWDTKEEVLHLDKWGYPSKLPSPDEADYTSLGTRLYHQLEGHYPGGMYTLSFKGKATLDFETYSNSHKTTVISSTYDPKLNETVYKLKHENNPSGFFVEIVDIEKPISDLEFVLVDSTQKHPIFVDSFLESLEPYDNIRYLDWTKTSASREVTWGDRTLPKDISFGGAAPGEDPVPWEYIVRLSNTTDTNPWINIPHAADNRYVERLATMFANRLDEDLVVRVQYSNEPWGQPVQRAWMLNQANNLYNYKTDPSDNYKVADYSMQRTVEVLDIFEKKFEELGKDSDRVIGIFASQSSWTPWGERAFEYNFADPLINPNAKPVYIPLSRDITNAQAHDLTGIDELSVGFYFGFEIGGVTANHHLWTGEDGLDNIFKQIFKGGLIDHKTYSASSLDIGKSRMIENKKLADKLELPITAYEGGQHLSTLGVRDYEVIDNLIQANRDPRMKTAYLEHFKNYDDIIGKDNLFMHWVNVAYPSGKGYGSWGLEEYPGQADLEGISSTPKLDAIQQLM